jgi:glutathione S-transferase
MSRRVLYSYNVSPYAAKVRAALLYKQLPFDEVLVHPLKRGVLKQLSGQRLVPVLDDEGQVVHDSTRILAHLESHYPERPLLPSDPVERSRALLLEEWCDEGLRAVVQPVRWLIPFNFERSSERFASVYEGQRPLFRAIAHAIKFDIARRFGPKVGVGRPTQHLNRLAEVLDYVEGAIGPSGWLVGSEPSVADCALAGWITQLRDLDGWETVKMRRKVTKLAKQLLPEDSEKTVKAAAPEAYDTEDSALIEASRLRRSTKGKS